MVGRALGGRIMLHIIPPALAFNIIYKIKWSKLIGRPLDEY
jgi:hypothetical protein